MAHFDNSYHHGLEYNTILTKLIAEINILTNELNKIHEEEFDKIITIYTKGLNAIQRINEVMNKIRSLTSYCATPVDRKYRESEELNNLDELWEKNIEWFNSEECASFFKALTDVHNLLNDTNIGDIYTTKWESNLSYSKNICINRNLLGKNISTGTVYNKNNAAEGYIYTKEKYDNIYDYINDYEYRNNLSLSDDEKLELIELILILEYDVKNTGNTFDKYIEELQVQGLYDLDYDDFKNKLVEYYSDTNYYYGGGARCVVYV